MAGPAQRLPLEALSGVAIAPVISPLPTAVALIGTALTEPARAGSASRVRRALLAHLRPRDVAALLPLRSGQRLDGAGGRPNEVVPAPAGASLEEQLEAVAAVDPEALALGIRAAARAGHPVGPWRPVASDPARWLRAYSQALRRAWEVLEPLWASSAAAFDREVERVSVALARGAGPELLTQVFPYCAVAGDELLLPSHSGTSGRLRVGGSLLLHPLLAPASASGWTDDYGDVCLAVRYPLPGAWRSFDGVGPPPASLTALLGAPRATLLRRLERPATAGELAALLQAVPSVASHHLRALERAGLVTREREGRQIRVRRSARGTQLVALYERD
jgi:DNA-binding transcriptional ArsR family regulator